MSIFWRFIWKGCIQSSKSQCSDLGSIKPDNVDDKVVAETILTSLEEHLHTCAQRKKGECLGIRERADNLHSMEIEGFNTFLDKMEVVGIPMIGRKFNWYRPTD